MIQLLAFGFGPWELGLFALVVLLLFGNRLPSVARSMGRGIVEFKKGVQDVDDELEDKSQGDTNKDDAPKAEA